MFSKPKKSFLVVGYGKMGSAFVQPIRNDFDFTIVSPNSKPNFPAKYYPNFSSLQEIFDYILFAVKPQVLPMVMDAFPRHVYDNRTTIISVIAGARSSYFQEQLGGHNKIVRTMPNLPCSVGKGIISVFGDERLEFLDKLGTCVYAKNEAEIDKFTSFTGSGSGFCYSILEMYRQAAENLQIESELDQKEVVLNLFEGALALLRDSGLSFSEQRSRVAVPNGTTWAGLSELEKCQGHFDDCLQKSYHRATELGNQVMEGLDRHSGK